MICHIELNLSETSFPKSCWNDPLYNDTVPGKDQKMTVHELLVGY